MKHSFFERLNQFFSPKKKDSQQSQRMRLVGAQGDNITFLSDVPQQVHGKVTVAVSIDHDRYSHQGICVQSKVTGCRQVPLDSQRKTPSGSLAGGKWECTGDISGAPEHMRTMLERLFEEHERSLGEGADLSPSFVEKRQNPRQKTCFQVLSPDQRFKAMAVDLSACGVRLVTEQPIAAGTHLKLNMDVAVGYVSTLMVAAESVWSRQDPETGAFQNGLRFVDLSREQTVHIKRYLSLLQKGRAC